MSKIFTALSFGALAAIITACLLYFAGVITQAAVEWVSLAATVAWFATTPFWMGRELPIDAAEVEI